MSAADPLLAAFAELGPDGLKVVAHLGSSLDGRIATLSGHSRFVTGPDDLRHMHRLRAAADAVIVGGGTVAMDDPQLTVRLCAGRSPVRVVLDPMRRLGPDRRLFREMPPATLTLVETAGPARLGGAEVLRLAEVTPAAVLRALRSRGLRRLFVEGGGVTVSRFVMARCVDQLQVCIAPVVIGSGRPAFTLPPIATMADALRPPMRAQPLGDDVLFVGELARPPLSGEAEEIAVADPTGG